MFPMASLVTGYSPSRNSVLLFLLSNSFADISTLLYLPLSKAFASALSAFSAVFVPPLLSEKYTSLVSVRRSAQVLFSYRYCVALCGFEGVCAVV